MRFASLFVGRSGAALAGGLATALLAGFIWAAVARYTGIQFGILAWGLGLGVGFCVAFIARQQNQLVGVAAAFVALLGWFAGKVAILYWAIPIIAAAELSPTSPISFGGLNSADTAQTLAITKLHEAGTLDDDTYNGYYEDTLSEEGDARVEKMADDWIAANGAPDMEAEMVEGIRDGINEQPMFDAMAEYEVIGWIDGLWVFLMVGSAWKDRLGRGPGRRLGARFGTPIKRHEFRPRHRADDRPAARSARHHGPPRARRECDGSSGTASSATAPPPEAYADRALPIGLGQTISQPYIVAQG